LEVPLAALKKAAPKKVDSARRFATGALAGVSRVVPVAAVSSAILASTSVAKRMAAAPHRVQERNVVITDVEVAAEVARLMNSVRGENASVISAMVTTTARMALSATTTISPIDVLSLVVRENHATIPMTVRMVTTACILHLPVWKSVIQVRRENRAEVVRDPPWTIHVLES